LSCPVIESMEKGGSKKPRLHTLSTKKYKGLTNDRRRALIQFRRREGGGEKKKKKKEGGGGEGRKGRLGCPRCRRTRHTLPVRLHPKTTKKISYTQRKAKGVPSPKKKENDLSPPPKKRANPPDPPPAAEEGKGYKKKKKTSLKGSGTHIPQRNKIIKHHISKCQGEPTNITKGLGSGGIRLSAGRGGDY